MQPTDLNLWRIIPLFHAFVFGATAIVGRILIARNRMHNAVVAIRRGTTSRDASTCGFPSSMASFSLSMASRARAGCQLST
jgi:hypothetical protein